MTDSRGPRTQVSLSSQWWINRIAYKCPWILQVVPLAMIGQPGVSFRMHLRGLLVAIGITGRAVRLTSGL